MDSLVSRRSSIWTSSPGFKEVPFRGSLNPLNPLNRWTFWPFKERCVSATRRINLSWSMKNILKRDLLMHCKGTYIQLRVTPNDDSTMSHEVQDWILEDDRLTWRLQTLNSNIATCTIPKSFSVSTYHDFHLNTVSPAERSLISGISNCFGKSWHNSETRLCWVVLRHGSKFRISLWFPFLETELVFFEIICFHSFKPSLEKAWLSSFWGVCKCFDSGLSKHRDGQIRRPTAASAGKGAVKFTTCRRFLRWNTKVILDNDWQNDWTVDIGKIY